MFINFLNNYLIYTLVEFLENKNNSIHFFFSIDNQYKYIL